LISCHWSDTEDEKEKEEESSWSDTEDEKEKEGGYMSLGRKIIP